MKKTSIILVMLIFNFCFSQNKKTVEKRTIEVTLNSVGKTNIDKKTIFKVTGINKKNEK